MDTLAGSLKMHFDRGICTALFGRENMQLLTERQLILGIAEAWERQYPECTCNQRNKEALIALRQLDLTVATAEDIEAVIGNDSWTAIWCSECGCRIRVAVQLGGKPDYASATAVVCFDCLEKALALEPKSYEVRCLSCYLGARMSPSDPLMLWDSCPHCGGELKKQRVE